MKQIVIRDKIRYTPYRRQTTASFLIYVLFLTAVWVGMLFCFYFLSSDEEQNDAVLACLCIFLLLLFVAVSLLMVTVVIPRLKRKQAEADLKTYDFSSVVPVSEAETFDGERLASRYLCPPDPFLLSETVCLPDWQSFQAYRESKIRDVLSLQVFAPRLCDFPFSIVDYSDRNAIGFRVKVNSSETETTFEVFELYRAEFTKDGLRVGGMTFSYDEVTAWVSADFNKNTGFSVLMMLTVCCSSDVYLSFRFGARIAAIVDRFGVKVENREAFDYILKDPCRAFYQTAAQLGLRKLK